MKLGALNSNQFKDVFPGEGVGYPVGISVQTFALRVNNQRFSYRKKLHLIRLGKKKRLTNKTPQELGHKIAALEIRVKRLQICIQ